MATQSFGHPELSLFSPVLIVKENVYLSFFLSWNVFLFLFLSWVSRKKEKHPKKERKEEKHFPQLLVWGRKKKLKLGMKMGK